MKLVIFIAIVVLSSCSSPEPGTDEWFEEKYEEFLAVKPDVTFSLDEFKNIFASSSSERIAADNSLLKKHSIAFWLMDDNFWSPSEDLKSITPTYIMVLKQCAANFSVMYGNMQAGLLYGKTITGLDDAKEISRLSDDYMNHAKYFASRAEEVQLTEFSAADWDSSGNNLTYLEMIQNIISNEISLIQDEIFLINSDETFLELLETNEEICLMVRDQNPNNINYIFN